MTNSAEQFSYLVCELRTLVSNLLQKCLSSNVCGQGGSNATEITSLKSKTLSDIVLGDLLLYFHYCQKISTHNVPVDRFTGVVETLLILWIGIFSNDHDLVSLNVNVIVRKSDGSSFTKEVLCRIDTLNELNYYNSGGILQYVLQDLVD